VNRDYNPGPIFSIPGFRTVTFLNPKSYRDTVTTIIPLVHYHITVIDQNSHTNQDTAPTYMVMLYFRCKTS
jgi:hypothetical protein